MDIHSDERGWLTELFRRDETPEQHLPAMSYVSATKPGVTRGPHEHREQADFFAFVGPSTFRLYMWDNRPDSPTYRTRFKIEGGESRKLSVIVPPGVVHAYKNIGEVDGFVFNAPNRLFAGEGKKSDIDHIRHEDDPESPFKWDE